MVVVVGKEWRAVKGVGGVGGMVVTKASEIGVKIAGSGRIRYMWLWWQKVSSLYLTLQ